MKVKVVRIRPECDGRYNLNRIPMAKKVEKYNTLIYDANFPSFLSSQNLITVRYVKDGKLR